MWEVKESLLRRNLNRLYLWSGWLAGAFIAAIFLLVLCQVGLNLIDRLSGLMTGKAVGLTIPSYADFTGFFLAAASFLALAHTLRQGGHIRVSLVIAQLDRKMRHIFEIWCLLLTTPVSAYFTWYTISLTRESYTYHDLSPGMVAVPLWIPQSAMSLGLAILTIALIDELLATLRGGKPSYAGAGERLLDDDDPTS
ncbi:TRAP transporter small permease [Desulfopila inferna]|uniref:TRAP transporter small permease n=1 Tax=Desulfopila inferna TaxID=468528 RepID=UPI001F069DC6|nr:TRAP transporter small permease [Desulfopila inferna]